MSENCIAYMIPSYSTKIVSDLDGLVLQGGSDVSPESYGEKPLKPEWNGDRIRDLYEIALVKEFIRQGKPILGICRGLQLLNVALGGTLYQDIQTQVPNSSVHRNWEIYDAHSHEVVLEPNSLMSSLYPGSKIEKVNSVHHQGIDRLSPSLTVEARSKSDGLIEAVRMKVGPFVYAVQWHPEFHNPDDQTFMDGKILLREFLKNGGKNGN